MIPAAAVREIAAGRSGVYLVTIRAGGVEVRAATRPADVPWDNGVGLQFASIVSLEPLQLALDPMALTGIGSYQTVQVRVADEDVDAVSLQLAGHPLAGAEVEIALWWPGLDYEQRSVVLRGRMRTPTLQNAGRLSSFTATAIPSLAGSEQVGDAERDLVADYPARPAVSGRFGELVPTLLGRCANVPGLKVGPDTDDQLLLAGHWMGGGEVTLYEDGSTTPTAGSPYSLINTTSDAGTKVAIVEGASAFEFTSAGALTADLSACGGAPRVDGAGPTTTAADVLVWLLTRSGRRVDWPRCQRALAYLSTWVIGVYLDEPACAVDLVTQRLLPVLPLVAIEGGDGLWYHYADLELGEPEADLVEGQHLLGPVPDSGLTWSSEEDCRTAFSVRYHRDSASGEFAGAITLDDQDDALCALAREQFGPRADEGVDGLVIWAENPARRVAVHQARRRALPVGSARFVVEPEAAVGLREGSVVAITWPAWGLERRRALVAERYPAGDRTEVKFLFAPASPVRDGGL